MKNSIRVDEGVTKEQLWEACRDLAAKEAERLNAQLQEIGGEPGIITTEGILEKYGVETGKGETNE